MFYESWAVRCKVQNFSDLLDATREQLQQQADDEGREDAPPYSHAPLAIF